MCTVGRRPQHPLGPPSSAVAVVLLTPAISQCEIGETIAATMETGLVEMLRAELDEPLGRRERTAKDGGWPGGYKFISIYL